MKTSCPALTAKEFILNVVEEATSELLPGDSAAGALPSGLPLMALDEPPLLELLPPELIPPLLPDPVPGPAATSPVPPLSRPHATVETASASLVVARNTSTLIVILCYDCLCYRFSGKALPSSASFSLLRLPAFW